MSNNCISYFKHFNLTIQHCTLITLYHFCARHFHLDLVFKNIFNLLLLELFILFWRTTHNEVYRAFIIEFC